MYLTTSGPGRVLLLMHSDWIRHQSQIGRINGDCEAEWQGIACVPMFPGATPELGG